MINKAMCENILLNLLCTQEVSMEYVFLFTLDIKDERPVEEIIAEMTTFLSMLRDAEAAKRMM